MKTKGIHVTTVRLQKFTVTKEILVSCCVRSSSAAYHGFNAAAAPLLGKQRSFHISVPYSVIDCSLSPSPFPPPPSLSLSLSLSHSFSLSLIIINLWRYPTTHARIDSSPHIKLSVFIQ